MTDGDSQQGQRRLMNLAKLLVRPKPVVGETPSEVVFTENKWSLRRYRARPAGISHPLPILLVPSLINRHYVLDLMKGKSFVEYLVMQGYDVFVIDWGTPADEDRYVTFDDICDTAIGRAIRRSAKIAGAEKVHLLGYCLGGLLTTIHVAVHDERVASMCVLAAPVKFDGVDGMLESWTRTPTFDVRALVDGAGNVPARLLQSAFMMLRPTLGLSKTVHMIDRAWDDEFLDGFLALEAWGNDNVSFPGECYARYIEEIYRKDALAKGTFTLSGKPALLENVKCPLLVVSFEHDTIVPKESAVALVDRATSLVKQHVHLPGGHVGAVVSRAGAKRLWPVIDKFYSEQESAPRKTPASASLPHGRGGGARKSRRSA